MSEERQRIIATIAHSGKSLLLTVTRPSKTLGLKAGDKVSMSWDSDQMIIRRVDKP